MSEFNVCPICQSSFTLPRKRLQAKVYLFDIEGTTTPITFVKDTLFPYAKENVKSFLENTWDSNQTKNDVNALIEQSIVDQGLDIGAPFIQTDLPSEQLIESIVVYVQWNILQDRKISSLKDLQGHIWTSGYKNGDLLSKVYDDVPTFFSTAVLAGSRVAIYSSGSRHAQNLLFRYSDKGDLRPFISCYFDTAIGGKRESKSYSEIALSLGVDDESDILFVTDIFEEAEAATKAGLRTAIAIRPGNAPLPASHNMKLVHSFDELV